MADELPEPKSRKESYLAKAAGMSVDIPEPESREEQYLNAIANGGGGGGGGTSDFNQLSNRPKYKGQAMTGSTDIPENFKIITNDDVNYTDPFTGDQYVALWKLPTGRYLISPDLDYNICVDTCYLESDDEYVPNFVYDISCTSSIITIDAEDDYSVFISIFGDRMNASMTTVDKATGEHSGDPMVWLGSSFSGTDGENAGTFGLVPAPYPADADKFLKSDGSWATVGGNSSSIKVLTTADYNWDFAHQSASTSTKDCIAIWLLEPGLYCTVNQDVDVLTNNSYNPQTNLYTANSLILNNPYQMTHVFMITQDASGNGLYVQCINNEDTSNTLTASFYLTSQGYGGNAQGRTTKYVFKSNATVDNLTSTSSTYPLSAGQGKVLKELIDGTTETYIIAGSQWAALSSSSPYTYSTTVTASHTIGANTVVEILNDQPVEFATYGFAVGLVSGQSVTIYSIGQPSGSETLKITYRG